MDTKTIASLALLLVQLAEYRITGTKQGAARKEQVLAWLYNFVPDVASGVITREVTDQIIENAVGEMKAQLEQAAEK